MRCFQLLVASKILRCTFPFSVNLNELERRFFRIWLRRCESVSMIGGSVFSVSISKRRFFASEIGLKVVSTNDEISLKRREETLAVINPDSIFDKSRISLMSWIKSSPQE